MKIAFSFDEIPSLATRSFVGDWQLIEQDTIKEFDSSTYVNDDVAGYSFQDYPANDAGFLMLEGLHTLGMILPLVETGLHIQDRSVTGLVYGLDRVRFTSPVYAGDRVRARGTIIDVSPRRDGYLSRIAATVELDGRDKPAYVAELLLFWYPAGAIDLAIPQGTVS